MPGAAKTWFELSCHKHGTPNKETNTRVLKGDPPAHKRGIKQTGCPVCRAEEQKEKQKNNRT